MNWNTPIHATVVNRHQLPIDRMTRIYPHEGGVEIYQASWRELETPMNWDNHKQTKIALIDRLDGDVCATVKFEEDNDCDVYVLLNLIACRFGVTDEPFLIVVADFPSTMLGFQANQFIAERGGYYFLAARHPIPEARDYFVKQIPVGSIKYV